MFALFIGGESYPSIGKAMKAKYPQFSSYFAYHNSRRISETIHIPTYAGFVKFGETMVKGNHLPIVDEITFQKAQSLLESRTEQWKSNRRRYNTIDSPYLLSGMLFCKFCGARYRVVPKSNKQGKRIIYECYSRIGAPKHMVKDYNCKAPIYKMEDLDSMVIAEVNKLLLNETCFNLARDETASSNDIVVSTKKELDTINSKINKLLDLYENRDFNSEIVSERLNTLEDKRKSLQLFLSSKIKSKPSITHPEFKNKYSSFVEISKNGVTTELRQLLRSLIEYIELSEEEIIFHWTF